MYASTIFFPTHSTIIGLHCHIIPKWMYWSPLQRKMKMTYSLPHPENGHQHRVNNLWHPIMEYPEGCRATLSDNWTTGCLSRQKWLWEHRYYVLKMSINGASTTFGPASWKIQWYCGDIYPESHYRPPFQAKMILLTSSPWPKHDHQWSINGVGPCILDNQGAVQPQLSIIILLAACLGKNTSNIILTMFYNDRQQCVNVPSTIVDQAPCII